MSTGRSEDEVVARLRTAGCVFAEEEAEVLRASAGSAEDLEAMVARRVAGAPLELVVGWAELAGCRIAVAAGVFVPRRRSELLVREAVRVLQAAGPSPLVVDLGCGTGALGYAVAREVPGVQLHAVDIDPDAVRCARSNLSAVVGAVHEGDLWDALPRELQGRVDVVVANAPYVPTDEIPLLPAEARDHEHLVALDGGADGVEVQSRVLTQVGAWLAPGGTVLVETSERQLPLTYDAFVRNGLRAEISRDPDLGATVVLGRRRS